MFMPGTPQLHYKGVGVACVNVLLTQVGVACDPGGSGMCDSVAHPGRRVRA